MMYQKQSLFTGILFYLSQTEFIFQKIELDSAKTLKRIAVVRYISFALSYCNNVAGLQENTILVVCKKTICQSFCILSQDKGQFIDEKVGHDIIDDR